MIWSVDPQVTIHGDWVSAIVLLMKLMCLMIIGLLLANSRTQIVPKATFKLLSKLVFALFLPYLIFVHLGQSGRMEASSGQLSRGVGPGPTLPHLPPCLQQNASE